MPWRLLATSIHSLFFPSLSSSLLKTEPPTGR
uniref:Uncharacterized protein n=1 Tax=Arundo donax TaxID=35708 RepID=A0A0A9F8K2_ARUDO